MLLRLHGGLLTLVWGAHSGADAEDQHWVCLCVGGAGAFIFEDVGVTAYKVSILACRTTKDSTAKSKANWHVMRVQSGRPLHAEAMRLGNSTLCRAHQPLAPCKCRVPPLSSPTRLT